MRTYFDIYPHPPPPPHPPHPPPPTLLTHPRAQGVNGKYTRGSERGPGRLLNVLCTFTLALCPGGHLLFFSTGLLSMLFPLCKVLGLWSKADFITTS